jgi:hypothetical protein
MINKIIISFFLLLFISIGINAQEQAFNFTASKKAEVRLGKAWDFTFNPMRTAMSIKLESDKLSMVYASGKEYWIVNVLEVKQTKITKENDKITAQTLSIKYKDKNNYIGYIIYDFTDDYGGKDEQLKVPTLINGWVTAYEYFSI